MTWLFSIVYLGRLSREAALGYILQMLTTNGPPLSSLDGSLDALDVSLSQIPGDLPGPAPSFILYVHAFPWISGSVAPQGSFLEQR